MPNYNYRKGDAFFAVDRFSGIDLRVRGGADPGAARKCVNYRISPSFGLVPRCGFSPLGEFSENVRAMISCRLGGCERLFCAAKNKFYSLGGANPVEIGTLGRNSGDIVSFVLEGKLFLIDGTGFYSYDGTVFQSAVPYIPMRYSYTDGNFEVREKLSAVTDRVRIRFPVITGSKNYVIPTDVQTVISATDKTGADLGEFTVLSTGGGKTISFEEYPPNSTTCELVCTTEESEAEYLLRDIVISSFDAALYGRVTSPKIYLFSSLNRAEMHYSERPSSVYVPYGGQKNYIYFPSENRFTVGDGSENVVAYCRFLDRLFIFTEKDAWFVSVSTPDEASPLHSNVGCVIRGGAMPIDNNPVTVGRDGLYVWKRVTGYSECSAEIASEAIAAELTPEMIASSVSAAVRSRDEIWLCPSLACGGGAYVWDYRRGIFYKFSGFSCDFVTEYGEDAVFASGNKVFAFSETNTADNNGTAASPVIAEWENGACPFNGYPEQKKLRRASFTVTPDGGSAELSVIPDNGREFKENDRGRIADAGSTDLPLTFMYLADVGRFRNAKIRLRSEGGRSEIRSVSLGIEVI